MKTLVSFTPLWLFVALTLPQAVAAYNPTNQQAFTIADTMAGFSIETTINASRAGISIPVFGSTQGADGTFGYEIFSDTSGVDVAGAMGLILANAPIVDNHYQLPVDTPTTLTIFIMAVPNLDAERQQLRARITDFPLGSSATLNEFELENYTTPKITI